VEEKETQITLAIAAEGKRLRPFLRLLETGVILQVPEGVSIRKALVTYFGMDPDYLENRIQTLFLNGKPVDDLDAAVVENGSVLALSAAMPGLVGATLRRGGYYAAMRRRIQAEQIPPETGKTAKVTVKLFNFAAKELGPGLFAAGVAVDASVLQVFLKDAGPILQKDDFPVTIDGKPRLLSELLSRGLHP